jgi:hypothetical protein
MFEETKRPSARTVTSGSSIAMYFASVTGAGPKMQQCAVLQAA